MVDQEDIATILAVARTGSFTRAAAELHVTQSTVTARVRKVEQELSVLVWDRTTRRLVLTADGASLMPLFQRMEGLFTRIQEMASPHQVGRRVVLGSVHSQWSSGIIPGLKLWATPLGIRWRLVTGHSHELLHWVQDGSLDLAITYFPASERGMKSRLLVDQPIKLLGGSLDNREPKVVTRNTTSLDRLVFLDWGHPFTEWFFEEFGDLNPVIQVDQAPLLLEILKDGGYLGFMPGALARHAIDQGQVALLDYQPDHPLPKRSVYVVSSERALTRPAIRELWTWLEIYGSSWLSGEMSL